MQKTKSLYEKQTNWPSLPVWTARVMWNTTRPRTVAMIFTFMMSSFSQSSLNSCCQWKGNEGSLYLSCSLHTISERLCATPCCVADSFNCTPAFVVCVLLTHLFFVCWFIRLSKYCKEMIVTSRHYIVGQKSRNWRYYPVMRRHLWTWTVCFYCRRVLSVCAVVDCDDVTMTYRCSNQRCIPRHLVNNSVNDCLDNSDEG